MKKEEKEVIFIEISKLYDEVNHSFTPKPFEHKLRDCRISIPIVIEFTEKVTLRRLCRFANGGIEEIFPKYKEGDIFVYLKIDRCNDSSIRVRNATLIELTEAGEKCESVFNLLRSKNECCNKQDK